MEYSDSQQRPNNQIDMKIKLLILFSLTLFVIKMSAQEMPGTANCFGERVIQDYLSYYETTQRTYPKQYHFPDTHFWFEDSDTRQMIASILNTHTDSLTTDTIFFICERGSVVGDNYLNVTSGDTLFMLKELWLDGYRTFEAYKTPFLNEFSKTYWEDLCEWDTVNITKPSKVITCGGAHSYIERLIYHSGQLLSVDFCIHGPKAEYDSDWRQLELYIKIPYPESKQ